jgi:hypothetical protein
MKLVNPHQKMLNLLRRLEYKSIPADIFTTPNGAAMFDDVANLARQYPGCVWSKSCEQIVVLPQEAPESLYYLTIAAQSLASELGLSRDDIQRIWLAEVLTAESAGLGNIFDDFGVLMLECQPLEEWGDREDHAPASISMDARGRERLIAALIEGRTSIRFYGESGGGYELTLVYLSEPNSKEVNSDERR